MYKFIIKILVLIIESLAIFKKAVKYVLDILYCSWIYFFIILGGLGYLCILSFSVQDGADNPVFFFTGLGFILAILGHFVIGGVTVSDAYGHKKGKEPWPIRKIGQGIKKITQDIKNQRSINKIKPKLEIKPPLPPPPPKIEPVTVTPIRSRLEVIDIEGQPKKPFFRRFWK
ncbi:hypothetical protein LCGC14_1518910 [marine sediment metagenome]|uniref:Uncharacterized protein n=1 Tax=marine sediment metagenome TaxID=412755 RepID=A0A0F9IZE2_9ZZZZ